MKMLILSFVYAPDRSPRAYRWSAIAEHWASEGHTVEVVCGWRAGLPRVETLGEVRLRRAGGALGERIRGWLGKRSHGAEGVDRPGGDTGGGPRAVLARLAKAVYGATWKQVYWPDYACLWYFPALRAAKALCRDGSYDAVVSVSHPFTCHLVGFALKRAYPDLRWIADVGDPFSLLDEIPLNNRRLYGALNRRVEGLVLETADAVAVTVDGCRLAYAEAFPKSSGKIKVIPPLLSIPPSAGDGRAPFARGAGCHLVFVGTLYSALRAPDALLALFAELCRRRDDLHLHFFGSLNDCAASFEAYGDVMGRHLHLHGTVPRATVAAAMSNADVLVNIGNSTPHQLPSKLVEYVNACKPVLNLVTNRSDTTEEFLARYPSSLTVMADDPAPNPDAIERTLAFLDDPPAVAPGAVDAFLRDFRIERVAEAYDELARGPGR